LKPLDTEVLYQIALDLNGIDPFTPVFGKPMLALAAAAA
jgi:hypothetical protein